MIVQSVWQKSLGFLGKPVVLQPSKAELTSDAGFLPRRSVAGCVGNTTTVASGEIRLGKKGVLRPLRTQNAFARQTDY